MERNFKFLSSLAIASLITTGIAGTALAATTDNTTKSESLGIYNQMITNKKVALFRLADSTSDRVTIQDIVDSGTYGSIKTFNGSSVLDPQTVVVTGDKFETKVAEYTVVVLGDVNKDGGVNVLDAGAILDNILGTVELDEAQLAAANLKNADGTKAVNVLDAGQLLDYVLGTNDVTTVSETVPTPSATVEKAEEEVKPVANVDQVEIVSTAQIKVNYDVNAKDYTYSLTPKESGDTAAVESSAFNAQKNIATLTVNPAMTANKEYTLTVKDGKGNVVLTKTFKNVALATPVTTIYHEEDTAGDYNAAINSKDVNNLKVKVTTLANDVDTQCTVTIKDSAGKEVTATKTLPAHTTQIIVDGFTGVADLKDETTVKLSAKVVDNNGNVAEEATHNVVKDAKELVILEVAATRASQSISLSAADVMISEVNPADVADTNKYTLYYMVEKGSANAKTASDVIGNDKKIGNATTIAVGELTENAEYTLYVVAKSVTTGNTSAVKAVKIAEPKLSAVATVNADSIAPIANEEGAFKWADSNTASDVKGYNVILLACSDNHVTYVPVAYKTVDEKEVNFLDEIKTYQAENKNTKFYTVKVQTLSDNAAKADSAYYQNATANDYAPKALAQPAITADSYKFNDGEGALSWLEVANNPANYVVNVYQYSDKDTVASSPITSEEVSQALRKCNVTNLLANLEDGKYALKVQAIASSSSIYVDSEESDALVVYKVAAPKDLELEVVDGNQLKATFSKATGLFAGETYDFRYTLIYDYTDKDDVLHENQTAVAASEISGTEFVYGKFAVQPEYKYNVRVQVEYKYGANVGDKRVVVESAPVELTAGKYLINLSTNPTLTLKNAVAANGDVSYDKYTNKVQIKLNDNIYDLTSDADNAIYSSLVPVLKVLTADDTVKITDGKVTAVTIATAPAVDKRNYGETLNGLNVTITANMPEFQGTFKNVTIDNDTAANLDLNFATIEKLTLDGNALASAQVSKGTKVVASNVNTNVNVNGIQVPEGTTVTAIENGLSIEGACTTVTVPALASTDLEKDLTVVFEDTQVAGVTVKSALTDHVVKVKGNFDSTLTLGATSFTGTIDITDAKYIATANNNAPVTIFTGTTVVTTVEKKNLPVETFKAVITPLNGEVKVSAAGKVTGEARIEIELGNTTQATTETIGSISTQNTTETVSYLYTSNTDYSNVRMVISQGSASYVVNENTSENKKTLVITTTADTELTITKVVVS